MPDSGSADDGSKTRLQRFLRDAGFGSLRAADAAVAAGRVLVNDRRVVTPTVLLAPGDVVTAGGRSWTVGGAPGRPHELIRLWKKPGWVVTRRDEHGRTTVFDALRRGGEDLGDRPWFYAGRLDADSRGLLLLTTDGALVQRLTHPSRGAEKIYEATVDGPWDEEAFAALAGGATVDGVRYAPFAWKRHADPRGRNGGPVNLTLTLREGKNREVRRLVAAAGGRVVDLLRTRMGDYDLDGLTEGAWQRKNL